MEPTIPRCCARTHWPPAATLFQFLGDVSALYLMFEPPPLAGAFLKMSSCPLFLFVVSGVGLPSSGHHGEWGGWVRCDGPKHPYGSGGANPAACNLGHCRGTGELYLLGSVLRNGE